VVTPCLALRPETSGSSPEFEWVNRIISEWDWIIVMLFLRSWNVALALLLAEHLIMTHFQSVPLIFIIVHRIIYSASPTSFNCITKLSYDFRCFLMFSFVGGNCWNQIYAVHSTLYTGRIYIWAYPAYCPNQVVNSRICVATVTL
jgi:hypothetical protein